MRAVAREPGEATQSARRAIPPTSCYVYLLVANDDSLYTGISGDPERRLLEHNEGTRGAKALRGKRPVRLLWRQRCESRSAALRLEARIKRLRAREKWSLALSNSAG